MLLNVSVQSRCGIVIMVHCCVPGCINHSSKTSNISYHRIPNDKALRKAWLARIRRDNLPPLQNCYVCSEHFTDDCFESDLKAQLPELKVKRRLKRDAIPSVFSHAVCNSWCFPTRSAIAGNFYVEMSRTNQRLLSFSRIGTKIWNGIPPKIRQLKKSHFKRKLNELLLKFLKIEEMNVDMRYINLSKYMAFL